ncbi:RNA polymerase sigma factor [Granulicella sp. S190]|jgi:RNA polymerase sigma-70 factor, ECF subfamily|uniref:RNA polymerase sigma factor n=1 Tax=Granulicella sp. S190 TaxID=1747226 RepID=UPI00131C68C4|nr:sigma-70 family RNA polymerase sigma factor [Granulicella sp. S190]
MSLSGEYGTPAVVPSPSDKDVSGVLDHMTPLSHQQLILAARSGCGAAFKELWDLYSWRVYRTTLGITKNEYDAEDALQDSFLHAFRALEGFEGRASFYTWLTRIAINSALGILRKRRCRPETSINSGSQQEEESAPEELTDTAPNPEQVFEQQQRHVQLMQAIHRLPASLREAVQLHIARDCSAKEVACQLNISEAAAKSRLYRASTRLGTMLAARYSSRVQNNVQ